jgi:biuret amidohydrolase
MTRRRLDDAVAEHVPPVRLDLATTALVVVDLQYASACRTTGLGRWLAEAGREDEGRYRFDRIERLVVPNVSRLLAFFRERSMHRLFVTVGSQMAGAVDLVRTIRDIERELGTIEGGQEFEILDEVQPLPGEPVLRKTTVSAFTSTGIDSALRSLGVRSLLFTGVSTSQCVDLTACDAADRGYECVVVEDAVAEDRPEWHDASVERFERLFGRVLTTDEVLAELRAKLPDLAVPTSTRR